MNKSELAAAIAKRTNMTQKMSMDFIGAFTETVKESLSNGESVRLIGFGNFEVRQRKARMGRNPQKPEETIMIPESTAPVFVAGKTFKDAVNG